MLSKKIIKWINKNIKTDLSDRVIFISGGNSGIGFEATRICLYLDMKVIWGCRNLSKAELAKREIIKEYPNKELDIVKFDLAELSSLKDAKDYLCINYPHINYLFNNAGVYHLDKGHTKDGFDLTIGTNAIGTYVFTRYLLDIYKEIKVIFTSSLMANFAHIDCLDYQMENSYNKTKAYCNSKLMVDQIFLYLSKQYTNNCFDVSHPGSTYTPLINKGYKNKIIQKIGRPFMKIFFHGPCKASLSAIYCLNDNVKNSYVGPRGLFGLSGYPKIKHLPKKAYIGYNNTVEYINKLINL